MDILTSKEIIHQEITKILNAYNSHTKDSDEKYEKLYEEWKQGKDMIHNLMEEIKEKDKILFMNEKKFVDYETMINKIQEEANKEQSSKERHDMLRIQDKEIHERDTEIKKLKAKVELLQNKLELVDNGNVSPVIQEVNVKKNKGKVKEDDKVKKVEEDEEVEKVEEDEKVEEVEKVEEDEEVEKDDKVEEVEKDDKVEEVEKDDKVEEVEEDDKVEEDEEDEETDEDALSVLVIKHYKKEYYIIENENPQYIYDIEGGGLGEKVGEIKGKKKVFYK